VTGSALPVHQFPLSDGTTLAAALNQPDYNQSRAEPDWEYAVGVEWRAHFPLSEAKTFRGVFANQNVVCKLSDVATVRFVREVFLIPADGLTEEGDLVQWPSRTNN